MKIITILAGVIAPVSVFAGTGFIENNFSIFALIFFGFFALIISIQFLPIIFVVTVMAQVIARVVSDSFVVQRK